MVYSLLTFSASSLCIGMPTSVGMPASVTSPHFVAFLAYICECPVHCVGRVPVSVHPGHGPLYVFACASVLWAGPLYSYIC